MRRQMAWWMLMAAVAWSTAGAKSAHGQALAPVASAEDASPTLLSNPLQSLPPDEARQVLQWAADWVRQAVPASYHGDKGWGKRTRIYAGFKVDVDDGRLKTKRRWKDVKHGRWLRYAVHLRDPNDPRRLDIRITHAEQGPDQRIRFAAQLDSVLDVELEQERWNLGTRLFSVSVQARVKLRMLVSGDVGFELDVTRIPPDLLADPQIASTELSLVDLKVDRISKIGGDVAESIGDLVKRIVRQEYLPGQQAAITQKLNAQLDRRRDRLRLGASQWFSAAVTRQPAETAGPMTTALGPTLAGDLTAAARDDKDDHQERHWDTQ